MFARFDENSAMTLQDIKETKRYGWTHAQMDNVKTLYPPQTKFARGRAILRKQNVTDESLRGGREIFRKQRVTDGQTHGRTHGRTI